jgi:TonB family protein
MEGKVVPAGMYLHGDVDRSLVNMVKGNGGNRVDRRFLGIAFLSVAAHFVFIAYVNSRTVQPARVAVIEEVPERFAKLIIERPLPKTENLKKGAQAPAEQEARVPVKVETPSPSGTNITPAEQVRARRAVDTRVARVEKKLRTVGVLGMLTGVGATAKGPSVVDVLGSLNDKKESRIDLEEALDKMTGLQKTNNIDVLNKKLVRSKDLTATPKENIDDLLANVGRNESVDLAKRGSFIIQKPESIEGAASTSEKRDNNAINAIVSTHKASIRMSYEKYLKRNPSLAGKITVRFTISATGSVVSATTVENTTGNRELEEEIMRKIRMWKFDSVSEGDVTVTYPFVFSSAG